MRMIIGFKTCFFFDTFIDQIDFCKKTRMQFHKNLLNNSFMWESQATYTWQSIALCDKIQFNLFQRGFSEGGTKLKLKPN